MPSPTQTSGRRFHLLAMLLLLATMTPHFPSLNAGFTYDDQEFVQHNSSITTLSAALRSFTAPFPPEQPERGLYRPVTTISYALDHALGGFDPTVFHRSNLLYYFLTVLLAYAVALRLLRTPLVALAAATLFAVHPVHCEAVDSIAGRSELLGLMFSLLAVWMFLIHRDRARWLFLGSSMLCALAAAMAKESGLMVLVVLGAVILCDPAPGSRLSKRLGAYVPLLACAALYLVARWHALDGNLTPTATFLNAEPLWVRLLTGGRVFAEYARLMVAPTELQVDVYYEHVIGVQREASFYSVAGLALLVLSLVGLSLLLLRNRTASIQPQTSGLVWYLAFLFPILHILPVGVLMAERLLFAPSFGFVLLVGAGMQVIAPRIGPRVRLAGLGLVVVITLLLGLRTWQRASEWHDSVTLWTPTLPFTGADYRVYNNLAMGYVHRRDFDGGITLLRRSLELRRHPYTVNNLAGVLVRTGHYDDAEALLKRLVRDNPNDPLAWNSLGVLHQRRRRPDEARRCYRRALRIAPNNTLIRKNLERMER